MGTIYGGYGYKDRGGNMNIKGKERNIMNDSELQEVIGQLHKLYDKRDLLDEEIEMKLLQLEDIIKEYKTEGKQYD